MPFGLFVFVSTLTVSVLTTITLTPVEDIYDNHIRNLSSFILFAYVCECVLLLHLHEDLGSPLLSVCLLSLFHFSSFLLKLTGVWCLYPRSVVSLDLMCLCPLKNTRQVYSVFFPLAIDET